MGTLSDFVVSGPTLDRWEIRRSVVARSPRLQVEVTAVGWCERRRKPLWTHTEVIEPMLEPMKVADVVHHLALVLEQDRPVTQRALLQGLLGENWDQLELPWGD